MTQGQRRSGRERPALDREALDRLALHYVGKYATTRAKLRAYLTRKLAERGWAGEEAAPVDALVERLAALRYIDDRAFAEMRGAGLTRRGYGARRVSAALAAAGIEASDAHDAREAAQASAWRAAIAFARRRRLGPFAAEPLPPGPAREKAIAAMIRAGHDFEMARKIVALPPGEIADDPD